MGGRRPCYSDYETSTTNKKQTKKTNLNELVVAQAGSFGTDQAFLSKDKQKANVTSTLSQQAQSSQWMIQLRGTTLRTFEKQTTRS
jgi:hypothetical protein